MVEGKGSPNPVLSGLRYRALPLLLNEEMLVLADRGLRRRRLLAAVTTTTLGSKSNAMR